MKPFSRTKLIWVALWHALQEDLQGDAIHFSARFICFEQPLPLLPIASNLAFTSNPLPTPLHATIPPPPFAAIFSNASASPHINTHSLHNTLIFFLKEYASPLNSHFPLTSPFPL